MRQYFLCFAGLFIAGLAANTRTTLAETAIVVWTRQLGTEAQDVALGVSADASGNAYVTGYTHGDLDGNTSAGGSDIFLTKYDTAGARLWTRQLGTDDGDAGSDVTVDSSGNAYVTGRTCGGLDGNTYAGRDDNFLIDYNDIFLTKYNADGLKLWTRQLGTGKDDYAQGVSVDSSGNAYITGGTRGDLDGNTNAGGAEMYGGYADMFLTKYNPEGVKLWTRQLGTDDIDYGNSVSVDGSGNVFVTGRTLGDLDGNTNAGDGDMFLSKYNSDGAKLWTRQLGSDRINSGEGVSVDGSGNTYVAGYTYGGLDGNTGAGGYDAFLTKYDTNGVKLWTRQLGSSSSDMGNGVTVDISGNAYITGYTSGHLDGNINAGLRDMFLTKFDTDGVKLWTQQLGTPDSEEGLDVSLDGSGNVFITGWTRTLPDDNFPIGEWNIVLAKISIIPEPGAATLLFCGLASLICWRRRV